VWRAICRYLQRWIPTEGAVLDLGAGYCDFINHITAATRYALDSNPASRQHAARGVLFLEADVSRDIPLGPGTLDVVFASNLVEHLSDSALGVLLAEARRVLKPGGRLILVQPNYYYSYRTYWDDFTHLRAWSHESLKDRLAADGWAVERVEKRFLPFSFRSRLPTSYLLTRLYLALPWRPRAGQMLVVARNGVPHVERPHRQPGHPDLQREGLDPDRHPGL
jgi:SAM-dependent methyltransferase